MPASRFLADLEALVAWSLLRSDVADGEVRLSMLETVREDAIARTRRRGRSTSSAAATPSASSRSRRRPRRSSRARTRPRGSSDSSSELDNIRAALDWFLTSGRVEDALRTVSALGRFWRAHGHVSEARRWLSTGLGLAEGVAPDVRADALWTAARQANAQNATGEAESARGGSSPLPHGGPLARSRVRALGAREAREQQDPRRAQALADEALRAGSEARRSPRRLRLAQRPRAIVRQRETAIVRSQCTRRRSPYAAGSAIFF